MRGLLATDPAECKAHVRSLRIRSSDEPAESAGLLLASERKRVSAQLRQAMSLSVSAQREAEVMLPSKQEFTGMVAPQYLGARSEKEAEVMWQECVSDLIVDKKRQ